MERMPMIVKDEEKIEEIRSVAENDYDDGLEAHDAIKDVKFLLKVIDRLQRKVYTLKDVLEKAQGLHKSLAEVLWFRNDS